MKKLTIILALLIMTLGAFAATVAQQYPEKNCKDIFANCTEGYCANSSGAHNCQIYCYRPDTGSWAWVQCTEPVPGPGEIEVGVTP